MGILESVENMNELLNKYRNNLAEIKQELEEINKYQKNINKTIGELQK